MLSGSGLNKGGSAVGAVRGRIGAGIWVSGTKISVNSFQNIIY